MLRKVVYLDLTVSKKKEEERKESEPVRRSEVRTWSVKWCIFIDLTVC